MEAGSLFVKTKSKTFSKVLQIDKLNNDSLMQYILSFFEKNNLKFENLSQVFVNQGPGNFSGLRSSLAIAKGISLSNNLNLFGYNTLLLCCSKFFNKKDIIYGIIKVRKKYFIKKFDTNLKSNIKMKEISIDELVRQYQKKILVAPKNLIRHFDEEILKLKNLDFVDLDHNELEFLKLKGLLDEELIKPLYLS
jgi:tRNA threonylcarbamoyl adenosine modification protein YeaZ